MAGTKRSDIKIEMWEIDKLIPYENNAKVHNEDQIAKIAKSISEFGWDQPIAVDKNGVIIKGHGRTLAAKALGMTHVPVVCRSDLTDDQVRAARLADNRVAQGGMDMAILQAELAELNKLELDLSLTGFDERELAFLNEDLGEMDDTALITDLTSSVEEHTTETETKVEEVKTREITVAKAFGFQKVKASDEALFNRFMTQVEEDTGKESYDALVHFMNELVGDNAEVQD